METSVEVYIWKPENSIKLSTCSLIYGHAAILIPWYSGARTEKPYPLYVSFHNTSRFFNQASDRAIYESNENNCRLHRVKLACTQEQIAKLWQMIRAMKRPEHAHENDFTESEGYYIPYDDTEKGIYNSPFNLLANRESSQDAYNCTTLIFKLLEDANVKLPSYRGSNKCRGFVTGILQLLSSSAAGYNLGVAIEICEACLPEETKHIQRGAWVSIGILVAALVMDCCCVPLICRSSNRVANAVNQRCPLPPSILASLSLPMLIANLIILIYIAIIHGQYHALFDNASVIVPLVGGILIGIGFCAFSFSRNIHVDAHTYVTKPEALLELLTGKKSETPEPSDDQMIALDDLSQSDTENSSTRWGSFFSQSKVKSSYVSIQINSNDDTGNEDSTDDLLVRRYV